MVIFFRITFHEVNGDPFSVSDILVLLCLLRTCFFFNMSLLLVRDMADKESYISRYKKRMQVNFLLKFWIWFYRASLELFASIVKCKSVPGLQLRHNDIDAVLIRENTEGEYTSKEHEVRNSWSRIFFFRLIKPHTNLLFSMCLFMKTFELVKYSKKKCMRQ